MNLKNEKRPVQIITPEENLVLEIGESKFFYRRIRAAEKNNIILKYTDRGKIDQVAATMEILKSCVRGWQGVRNGDGSEVEFTVDLIEALPESVLWQLETAIVLSPFGEVLSKN